MPMHRDERTDYLVRPIPESSDLPPFLCHFLCSADHLRNVRDFLPRKLRDSSESVRLITCVLWMRTGHGAHQQICTRNSASSRTRACPPLTRLIRMPLQKRNHAVRRASHIGYSDSVIASHCGPD